MLRCLMSHPSEPEVPPELLRMMEESEADLAAGRIVPLSVVLEEFQESIARLEAKRAQQSEPMSDRR